MCIRVWDEIHSWLEVGRVVLGANLSPLIENIRMVRKKTTETTTGIPNPPFLIMATRGAPIKNRIMHANDNVNLRCHSIRCLARFLLLKLISSAASFAILCELRAEFRAVLIIFG